VERLRVAPAEAPDRVTRHMHIGFVASSREAVEAFWETGRARATPTTASPARARSTATTTTARSCSTPTATAPRPSTTATSAATATSTTSGSAPQTSTRPRRSTSRSPRTRICSSRATSRATRTSPPAPGRSRSCPASRRGNLHLAFRATENATVDAFHAAATGAGYRDNGGPGERPVYHAGYYGAFVLDPDGNNIEVVNHNRG
jgi:catechol 2,3-dioxygenase-like lactoylglutathione lyase family enzyme